MGLSIALNRHANGFPPDPRSRQGFTLIELLVVTAVIAILAAVALPQLTKVREKGYQAAVISELKTLERAIEAYDAEYLAYPDAVSDLENVGYTPSAHIIFLSFKRETSGGNPAVHIHITHDASTRYYHTFYPTQDNSEWRDKKGQT